MATLTTRKKKWGKPVCFKVSTVGHGWTKKPVLGPVEDFHVHLKNSNNPDGDQLMVEFNRAEAELLIKVWTEALAKQEIKLGPDTNLTVAIPCH